jgi:hypothetical protein
MHRFKIGDRVLVLKDEGYDLKIESQGKYATVMAYVGDHEYDILTDDGVSDQVAYYHIIPAVTPESHKGRRAFDRLG